MMMMMMMMKLPILPCAEKLELVLSTVKLSVCPVHCAKNRDRIRMPFGIIGQTGPRMRHVVGFGISPRKGVFWGANLGRAIVTNGDFTAYVCDSTATRPSSQITLGRLVFLGLGFVFLCSHGIMPECYKDDVESQWKSLKFDPPPSENHWTDGQRNLHGWLRPWNLPRCKILLPSG